MSLLMQALKKAERAKQSHHADEEPAKPSEALDAVLELAPQEPAVPVLDRESGLALDPLAEPVPPSKGLSLSPLEMTAPEPLPREPVLDFVPPEPPPAPEPVRPTVQAPPPPPPQPAAPPQARRRNPPPPPPVPPRMRPKQAAPVLSARTIRMAAIGAGALIVAATLGYIYWHEMYGPGSSRHLPPVPMPGQNLPAAGAPVAATPVLTVPPGLDDTAAPAGFAASEEPVATPAGDSAPELPPAGAPASPSVSAAASEDAAPPAMARSPREQAMGMSPREQAMGAAPAGRATARAASGASDIRVARSSNPEQISPGVANGYSAYQRGDLPAARNAYQEALRRDPNSRDALLGLAAVALRAGEAEQAANHYARLLDANPDDADALAGMAAVRGDGGAESRLRQALDRNPDSAAALFALGNLYARQGRWPEAQQQYFRAYTSAPNNPDYAFNLAVGLDRLNQPRLAQTYYQRALELAGKAGEQRPVSFDRAAASERLRELSAGGATP